MKNTNNRLPNYVYLLLIGQSINLTTAVLSVTVAAIVGLSLAPNISYATIPYGLQFFAILISTIIFSNLMKKFGRYPIFISGIFFLFFSGITGFISLLNQNFIFLCISHFLLGLFVSTANFYRFAATDGLDVEKIPKATSIVISGGVVAAIIAPLLAIILAKNPIFPDYSLIYLALSFLSILLFLVIYYWNKLKVNSSISYKKTKQEVPIKSNFNNNIIIIGIIGGALGYYLMNLMMITSSLFLKESHSFNHASYAIQMHVLAMFLPSFFVAKIIKSINCINTIMLGFALIAISSLLPMLWNEHIFINISLIILGIGWNFTYSGGSTLLGSLQGEERIRIQGVNETIVAFFATLGAFLPAPILGYLGWKNTNLMTVILTGLIISLLIIIKFISNRRVYETN